MELLPADETKQGKTIKNLSKGVCSSRPTKKITEKYENIENQRHVKNHIHNMENIYTH